MAALTELYYTPSQTLQLAEWHVYGSSRVGIYKANKPLAKTINETIVAIQYQTRIKYRYNGNKQYELSNHLGNVLVTISDRRKAICNELDSTLSYSAVVVTATDYYSFGSPMVGRSYEGDTANKYRYGINTQEKDDEIYGKGNATTAEFWEYDTRLGRRWNLEPLFYSYPQLSPFCAFNNNPIFFTDCNGQKIIPTKAYNNSNYKAILDLLVSQDNTEFLKLYKLFDGEDNANNLQLDYKELKGKYRNAGAVTNVGGGTYFIDFNQRMMEYPSGKSSFVIINELQYKHLTDASMVIYTTHEFIHAKMRLEGADPNLDHEEIANKYRSTIVAVLTEYNEKNGLGLNAIDIANLAWTGLEKTEAFKKEFGDIDWKKLEKDNDDREYYNSLNKKQKSLIDSYSKGKYDVYRDKKGKNPEPLPEYSNTNHTYEDSISPNEFIDK